MLEQHALSYHLIQVPEDCRVELGLVCPPGCAKVPEKLLEAVEAVRGVVAGVRLELPVFELLDQMK